MIGLTSQGYILLCRKGLPDPSILQTPDNSYYVERYVVAVRIIYPLLFRITLVDKQLYYYTKLFFLAK